MPQQRKPNDLSRSLIALDMDTTLIAVVELSLSSWLVAGIGPGIERQPLKKMAKPAPPPAIAGSDCKPGRLSRVLYC
jgi:hypothetical protein